MMPATMRLPNLTTVIRSDGSMKPLVDIDGDTLSTRYNNKFVNPLEQHCDHIDAATYVANVKESVALLKSTGR